MAKNQIHTRNGNLFDVWSIVHVVFGVVFGLWFTPAVAIALLVIWEPIEIFILSPLLARINIVFGQETLRNSLSDIFFDLVGVAAAVWLLS